MLPEEDDGRCGVRTEEDCAIGAVLLQTLGAVGDDGLGIDCGSGVPVAHE